MGRRVLRLTGISDLPPELSEDKRYLLYHMHPFIQFMK